MFGEIIGIWCLFMWDKLGRPPHINLVELGPGRGTLMADLLRAAALQPEFIKVSKIHLIETSKLLRKEQKQNILAKGQEITWHDDFESVPTGPLLVIANEFFDALPVHQYMRIINGWRERLITTKQDRLVWTEGNSDKADFIPVALHEAETGAIFETSPERFSKAQQIAARLKKEPGAALIIDYGFSGPRLGDTFQAVSKHRFADPLAQPGNADLTTHVDFLALAAAVREAGAYACGPLSQKAFLNRLGITFRAEQLQQKQPDKNDEIRCALERLTGPEHMGTLFQVMAITTPGIPPPPPFLQN